MDQLKVHLDKLNVDDSSDRYLTTFVQELTKMTTEQTVVYQDIDRLLFLHKHIFELSPELIEIKQLLKQLRQDLLPKEDQEKILSDLLSGTDLSNLF